MQCSTMEMSDTFHVSGLFWVVSLEEKGMAFPSAHDRPFPLTPSQQLYEQGLVDYHGASSLLSILVGPH